MLYLLKASRVREYHMENLAVLCGEEHDRFSFTYGRRWVQPGLTIAAGTGAAIVFADSPYESFVPVRFSVIDRVDDSDDRHIVVSGTLGPFISIPDPAVLDRAWAGLGDSRPGRRWFAFSDDDHGLVGPRDLDDPGRAWDRIVTSLRSNGFYARSTIARVTRLLRSDGVEHDPAETVTVGDVVVAELDLRPPTGGTVASRTGHDAVRVTADPPNAASLVPTGQGGDGPVIAGDDTVRLLPLRIDEAGDVTLRLTFGSEPLLSCRPVIHLVGHTRPDAVVATDEAAAAVDARALVRFLERTKVLDDAQWLRLFDEVLAPVTPSDPFLTERLAHHAEAAGAHERAFDALLDSAARTAEADEALLRAALRIGAAAVVDELVATVDISDDAVFRRVELAARGAPPASVTALVARVLDDDLLGESKLTDLVRHVGGTISSLDVLCRAAERIAYVEPATAADVLVERWPDPATMPGDVLELLVDWDVLRDRTGPYLRHRIEHATHDGDAEALRRLAVQVSNRGGGRERAQLLAEVGLPLLLGDDPSDADLGFDMLARAADELAGCGEIDGAIHVLRQVDLHERRWRAADRRRRVDELADRVDAAIETDDRFSRWQRFRTQGACDALRPHLTNRTLHLVGGWRAAWADELERDLGVAKLEWHETSKDRSPTFDWADGLDADDIVIVITDFIGHATSRPIKDRCHRRGAVHLHAAQGRQRVLESLREHFIGQG